MKDLFDRVSVQCSRITTEQYSTSFSLGIRLLSPEIRPAVYAIYGFVRLADEIVDSFHSFDKAGLLKQLAAETYQAIAQGISINPILNSFQHVVNRYGIGQDLIGAFLESMEMDLEKKIYNRSLYEKYIYGSAEVVGLMCLRVFCQGNAGRFEELKLPAMKLGSVFQKVNFLRDIRSDSEELGRMYFPEVNFEYFTESDKAAIEGEIEAEFAEALDGIRKLPDCARDGVYLAYTYYRALFSKIRKVPARKIRKARIRVADHHKLSMMCLCLFTRRFNLVW